jgi:hypothetical protein
MSLQPLVGPGLFFSFLFFSYTLGRTPWTGDQPVARPLPTHRTTQTQNKCTQTSMPRVGLEPTIPAFERAKTVHASDRAATVLSAGSSISLNFTLCSEGPFSQANIAYTRTAFSSVQLNKPHNLLIRFDIYLF